MKPEVLKQKTQDRFFIKSHCLLCKNNNHENTCFFLKYKSQLKNRIDQIYKLYVRPHLDYGDIMYHKYDLDKQLNFTEQLEQTQYKAALAVSGAWKGTNRLRLLEEPGWETLCDRRRYRRRCLFLFFPIPNSTLSLPRNS